jgi:TolA-binding protein
MPTLEELQEREADVERQNAKLDHDIERRHDRIDKLQRQQEKDRRKLKKGEERERELEKAIAEKLPPLDSRACLDGATTFLGLKLAIILIGAKTSWEGTLVAADRTSHADDCGDKSSQAELYQAYLNGTGNPANPPGTSSHEGVNGGNGGSPVTTAVPVGATLEWYRWGLDVGGSGEAFEAGAAQLGFKVRQHPGESWHFNFEEDPTAVLKRHGVI